MTDNRFASARIARAVATAVLSCAILVALFGASSVSNASNASSGKAAPAAIATVMPTPDATADAIFLHAKAVWRDRTEPAFASWAVLARYRRGDKAWDNWWAASYRGADHRLALHRIIIFDDEKRRLKGVPIDLFGIKIADTNPDADLTTVDDPYISPSSSFGIVARRGEDLPKLERVVEPQPNLERVEGPRGYAPSPSPSPIPTEEPSPEGTPLEEIGRVNAVARDYRVRLIGTEHLRYGDAYHLALEPVSDPEHYRLRDLWVNTGTYETMELTVQGLYDGKPYDGARWTVSYVPFDGRYYVSQVRTDDSMRFGITNVDEFEFDFVDYHFPATIPNYTFERTF